jgi:hypothetical protein
MLSRGILWLIMMAGHAISAFLMRQMEFDADKAEIELAGSDAFKTTTKKVFTLDMVRRMLDEKIAEIWHFHHRLPDNLPVLLEQRIAGLPATAGTAVERIVGEKKSPWSATHPSPGARISRAEAMQCAGQRLSDTPARQLFRCFEDLCHGATLGHYNNLGVLGADSCLIPINLLLSGTPSGPPVEQPARATIPFQFDDAAAIRTGLH